MTERRLNITEASKIKDFFERGLAVSVLSVGLELCDGSAIHCDRPVKNKWLDLKKRVTHPDFEVIEPSTRRSVHVEVTAGNTIHLNISGHNYVWYIEQG